MGKFSDVNICIFTGRLFADPTEQETKSDTKVANFSLAVNKYSKNEDEEPNSLRFTAFGKTAEFILNYFKKGTKVLVRGRVDTGSYEKNGEKQYYTRFIAETVNFAEGKKKDSDESEPAAEIAVDDSFINVPDMDMMELPFA